MSEPRSFENATLPTPAEVRARTSLIRQAWRFAALNVKMLAMVRKGGH